VERTVVGGGWGWEIYDVGLIRPSSFGTERKNNHKNAGNSNPRTFKAQIFVMFSR
jgi:hypothetical protein